MDANTYGEDMDEPGRARRHRRRSGATGRTNECKRVASEESHDQEEFESKILKALRERTARREAGEASDDPGVLLPVGIT